MSIDAQQRETVVLLVEDDRDDFYLTQDLLKSIQREPHRVVWAASYDAAKLELEERPFDVALVDYRIDGRTGLEFISQVGSNFPHCPMILLTGLQDPGIDLAAQQAGAVDYLAKDSLTVELLDRSIRYARHNTQRFALLDRVLTSAAAGVISVSASGVPIVWNRRATDALGLAPPLRGKITSAMVREALSRLVTNDMYPEEFSGAGDRSYQLSVSEGPEGGAVFVFHDISGRARTEQLLRQAAAEAEAASQAKSSFLATMSHELRTPLNGILGMTRVLSASALDDAQRDHLSVIRASGESLLQIINDILDLSKIEAGKVTLDDVDVDLAAMLDDLSKLLAPTAFSKGLELTVFADPQLPTRFRGDPLRIKQVLTNLLGNAVKFTTTGSITLSAVYEAGASASHIHFTVMDTGSGIEPDKVDLLFKRFSQVDSSNTRRHSGTGLGLALCKELARLMDGTMWYAPGQPGGSEFHFRMPVPGEHEAVVQSRMSGAKVGAGARLIAITASQAIAAMVETYGDVMGHTVIWAPSERDAANALQQHAASCILLDGRMTGLDARALLQTARRQPGEAAPALVLIDDYPARGPRASAGPIFDATLSRPFGVEYVDTICRLLDARVHPTATTPKSGPGAQGPAPAATSPSRLNILMAEDNAPNRLVASALLKSAGYALDIAEDGVEVVERALARSYDVILMDVQMPRLDGIGATKQIRACEKLKHIPIIGLSASAMKKDRDTCIAAGMSDYLPKPVDWDQLLTLLAQIEKGGRMATTNAA